MAFVDFNISRERKVDSAGEDNSLEISAYFCRGHYEMIENSFTKEMENTYVRDERFKEVTLIFLPDVQDRNEIMQNFYDILLEEKNNNDQVIPECVY